MGYMKDRALCTPTRPWRRRAGRARLAGPRHHRPRLPSSSRAPHLQIVSAATRPLSRVSAHLHRSPHPSRHRRSACHRLLLRATPRPQRRPPPPASTPRRAQLAPPGRPTCPCLSRPQRGTRPSAPRRSRPACCRQPSRMLGRRRPLRSSRLPRSSRSPPMRPSRVSSSSSSPSPSRRTPSALPRGTRRSR